MLVAYDSETYKIRKAGGTPYPRMVCGSFAYEPFRGPEGRELDRDALLLEREEALDLLEWHLQERHTIVAHNLAFDALVSIRARPRLLPLWEEAGALGCLWCTEIAQRAIDNARGGIEPKNNLGVVAKRLLGVDVEGKKGGDAWRLRYGELDGTPIDQYPRAAYDYALKDAIYALQIYDVQVGQDVCDGLMRVYIQDQTASMVALGCATLRGIYTYPDRVAELENELMADIEKAQAALVKAGLARREKTKIVKSLKAIRQRVGEAYRRQGREVPKTDKGGVKTDKDTLLAAMDSDLAIMAEYNKLDTRAGFLWSLKQGVDRRLTPSYRPMKATGRTSATQPNIQNYPKAHAFRRCFRPALAFLFLFADYAQIELCTLAQSCLDVVGYSRMAERLRAGDDLHVYMAEHILQADYDASREDHQEMRQLSKALNYGAPGGMGAAKLQLHLAKWGHIVTLERARELLAIYATAWPEVAELQRYASTMVERGKALVFPRAGLVRKTDKYTEACNTHFQGPAATGALAAVRAVMAACYVDRESPLYGGHMLAFVHDEILCEVPETHDLPAAAAELSRLMVEAMERITPDIPIQAEAIVSDTWSKKARPMAGNRIPWGEWDPKLALKETKTRARSTARDVTPLEAAAAAR